MRPRLRDPRRTWTVLGRTIESVGDLRAYVVQTTILCASAALVLDVANQLAFFVDWPGAIRSWVLTVLIAGAIAAPVARAIGKANLDLFKAKSAVEVLSRTDPLTGLLNRRALLDESDGAPAAMILVIVDIDRFKRVNDSYGHMAGDEVLRVVADLMRQALSDLGRVGRLGGEEFALLSHDADPGLLSIRLESFRQQVALTPVVIAGASVSVTISAGWAVRRPGQAFASLYIDADRALYDAKARGRNVIVRADTDRHHQMLRPGMSPARGLG